MVRISSLEPRNNLHLICRSLHLNFLIILTVRLCTSSQLFPKGMSVVLNPIFPSPLIHVRECTDGHVQSCTMQEEVNNSAYFLMRSNAFLLHKMNGMADRWKQGNQPTFKEQSHATFLRWERCFKTKWIIDWEISMVFSYATAFFLSSHLSSQKGSWDRIYIIEENILHF